MNIRRLLAASILIVVVLVLGSTSFPWRADVGAGGFLGDVNCDGGVTSVDAVLILQFDAGLVPTLTCIGNADVNGDQNSNSLDAVLVLQHVAGLIVILESSPDPIVLTGEGQQATEFFHLLDGLSIFRMTHDGSSNFIIWLLNDDGQQLELLVNEIGSFDGATAIGIEDSGDYLLDVSADGNWNVTIEQPRSVGGVSPPVQMIGNGQQASDFLALEAGLVRFELTHDGDSNFIVWLLRADGSIVDLLVNEIGSFDGSTALQVSQGIYILDISADGNWAINVEQ